MLLSINKSHLFKFYNFVNSTSLRYNNVIIPGLNPKLILKPNIRLKTSKGKQLIHKYKIKNFYNIRNFTNINDLFKRLDVILFYMHFTSSILESQMIIKRGLVKVNNVIIKKIDYNVPYYSLISCDYKHRNLNYIAHSIKNIYPIPNNINYIGSNKGIFTNTHYSFLYPKFS